ncbi:transposase [Streptomyces sp. NPDC002076]
MISPHQTTGQCGPCSENLRDPMDGIILRFRSQSPWRDVREVFGPWLTDRFAQWRPAGVLAAVMETVIVESARRGQADLSLVSSACLPAAWSPARPTEASPDTATSRPRGHLEDPGLFAHWQLVAVRRPQQPVRRGIHHRLRHRNRPVRDFPVPRLSLRTMQRWCRRPTRSTPGQDCCLQGNNTRAGSKAEVRQSWSS